MGEISASNFLSQAEFARRRGVSKKSVTAWKHKGLLVLSEDGKVNVEETEWNLDQRPATYRGGVTHRPVRTIGNDYEPKVTVTSKAKTEDAKSEDPDYLTSSNLQMAEAVRRKENFLGLRRRHELEVARQEWVRVEDVGIEVEREYATVRERLLTIPGKIASALVGVEQTEIEATIRAEITEALNELHDPAGVAERVIVSDSLAGRAPDPSASAGSQPN